MTAPTDTWHGRSKSPAQTVALGRAMARHARAGDLIALFGELGAGKTQLVRGLAEGLGVQQASVTSPTFVMAHEYLPADAHAGRPRLVHIDAYRLHSLEDIESIGWEITGDTLGGEMRQGAVVVVEWADRLHELLGDDRLNVTLSHEGETERGVGVTGHGSWRDRLSALSIDLKAALAPVVTGKCPVCNAPTRSDSDLFPFCGDRCRKIDLGKWLKEDYVISRPVEQRDLEEGVD